MSIDAKEFYKWLQVFGVVTGGGGGGGAVTKAEVQQSAFNFKVATGVDDAFIVALNPAVTALTDGLLVTMSSGSLQNTLPNPTLQVNALTPVPIEIEAGVLAPDDIAAGNSYIFVYNSASNTFKLINPTVSTANTFAVQSNVYNTAIDAGGAANTYVATINPAPPSIVNCTFVDLIIAHTNTGASTLTLNGTTLPIVQSNGLPLFAGQLIIGQVAELIYSSTFDAFVLINPAAFIDPATGIIVQQISFSDYTKGILGTTLGDNAAAGYVGQFMSNFAAGTTVPMTSVVATNILSMLLPAGDWDVWGVGDFIPAVGTTVSLISTSISPTSATITPPYNQLALNWNASSESLVLSPVARINVAVTTTVYLVAYVDFSVSTLTAGGRMYARRRR